MAKKTSSLPSSTGFRVGVALVLTVAATAVYAHGGYAPTRSMKQTAEEQAAFAAAKPAFERHCFRCHTVAGKKSKRKARQHLAMDAYPFAGHHAGEAGKVVRKALGGGGARKATMPSDDPGSVTGEDLRRIIAWADAFDRAHAGPAKTSADSRERTHAH